MWFPRCVIGEKMIVTDGLLTDQVAKPKRSLKCTILCEMTLPQLKKPMPTDLQTRERGGLFCFKNCRNIKH